MRTFAILIVTIFLMAGSAIAGPEAKDPRDFTFPEDESSKRVYTLGKLVTLANPFKNHQAMYRPFEQRGYAEPSLFLETSSDYPGIVKIWVNKEKPKFDGPIPKDETSGGYPDHFEYNRQTDKLALVCPEGGQHEINVDMVMALRELLKMALGIESAQFPSERDGKPFVNPFGKRGREMLDIEDHMARLFPCEHELKVKKEYRGDKGPGPPPPWIWIKKP